MNAPNQPDITRFFARNYLADMMLIRCINSR